MKGIPPIWFIMSMPAMIIGLTMSFHYFTYFPEASAIIVAIIMGYMGFAFRIGGL